MKFGSSTTSLAPCSTSSAGWNSSTALPVFGRFDAIFLPNPAIIDMWPSWPQECATFLFIDLYIADEFSLIGRASSSALKITVFPGEFPLKTKALPVLLRLMALSGFNPEKKSEILSEV